MSEKKTEKKTRLRRKKTFEIFFEKLFSKTHRIVTTQYPVRGSGSTLTSGLFGGCTGDRLLLDEARFEGEGEGEAEESEAAEEEERLFAGVGVGGATGAVPAVPAVPPPPPPPPPPPGTSIEEAESVGDAFFTRGVEEESSSLALPSGIKVPPSSSAPSTSPSSSPSRPPPAPPSTAGLPSGSPRAQAAASSSSMSRCSLRSCLTSPRTARSIEQMPSPCGAPYHLPEQLAQPGELGPSSSVAAVARHRRSIVVITRASFLVGGQRPPLLGDRQHARDAGVVGPDRRRPHVAARGRQQLRHVGQEADTVGAGQLQDGGLNAARVVGVVAVEDDVGVVLVLDVEHLFVAVNRKRETEERTRR